MDIIEQIKQDIASGKITMETSEGYRYYTDGTLKVPITTKDETLAAYKRTFIDVAAPKLSSLPRVSMYVGKPDTGKTYEAFEVAKKQGIKPLFIMCRDNLTLETLLEDFLLVEGKPAFETSLALEALSGTDDAIIILDEFNTLLTGVMKTFQPLFDDTSPYFEYKGKIYNKNMNCKFIVTLNEKDAGVSTIPDAILSRCSLRLFEDASDKTLARWTGETEEWIENLRKVYTLLGIQNLFGTRQIKAIKTTNNIMAHLKGLCSVKNIEHKVLDTLQAQTLLNKLM